MLKRTLAGLIRSHEATGEQTNDPLLKTRYYKISKDQTMDEVVNLLKKLSGYKLLHEVRSVGEIVLERRTFTGRTQDITITLFGIHPMKTAIDIYSASRGSLGDLGSNYRTITELLKHIDKRLAAHKIND